MTPLNNYQYSFSGFLPSSFPQSFAYFENEVIHWGIARKIVQHSTSRAQASKANEEVDELLDHTSALRAIRQAKACLDSKDIEVFNRLSEMEVELLAAIEDDIGDIIVCLIMVASIEGLDLKNCLAKAYSEIKDRKGEMRADGKFYKESPATST